MSLSTGSRIGPYEVLAPLGAGGMGEVWRARDTRLQREVALKVLPAGFAGSEPLRARFEREARAISALNHPHICTLHDVGQQDGVDYLVMELIEGESLADRLARGPLPMEQVLRTGAQVAAALDVAHRHGVVHRDLKPANVMLTKGGAKLLDFGLAKTSEPVSGASAPTAAATMLGPTAMKPLTEEGTVLGTFQYMAPEQLEGGVVDARTDIFALGALLYEMATGRRAFGGKSRASLIAAILASEPPPVSAVQPVTPPAFDRLVRTCLAKDPDERWQSAHDVKVELEGIAEGGAAAAGRVTRRAWLPWAVAGAMALTALGLGVVAFLDSAPRAEPLRLTVAPPQGSGFNAVDGPVNVSPDGRSLLVRMFREDGKESLVIRRLDSYELLPVPGVDAVYDPFWSPDGRNVGFFEPGKMRRTGLGGGAARTVVVAGDSRGASWSERGVILYAATTSGPLMRVSAEGGKPEPATRLDPELKQTGHWRPCFLPGGTHFVFTAKSTDPELSGIYLGSLDDPEVVRVLDVDSTAVWAPPGYLLYQDAGRLYALPFDAERRARTGDPVAVAEGVAYSSLFGAPGYHAAGRVLAYHPRQQVSTPPLVRIDRATRSRTTLAGIVGNNLDLSRDDRRIAVSRAEGDEASDVWAYDLERGTGTRLSYGPTNDFGPVWSGDGRWVVYIASDGDRLRVVRRLASGAGAEETLFEIAGQERERRRVLNLEVVDWTRDGRWLVLEVGTFSARGDLALLDLEASEAALQPLVATPFQEQSARFSADGRWVAYQGAESGREEIYVQPMPPDGSKWQVSTDGGSAPRWRADGGEIFYSNGRAIFAVPVTRRGGELELGTPEVVVDEGSNDYVVTSDGGSFLVASAREQARLPIQVVLDWTAGLEKRD
jgi:Tol biopolymer transport system component